MGHCDHHEHGHHGHGHHDQGHGCGHGVHFFTRHMHGAFGHHGRWGDRHFGPPWAQRHDEGDSPLRGSVFALLALVRAAQPGQEESVRAVLDEARRRIAAIFAESVPATPTSAKEDRDITHV